MKIINRTSLTIEEIERFPQLKIIRNEWRRRTVYVYQAPHDPLKVFSIGISFGQTETIVCEEYVSDYQWELNQKANPLTVK
jgi:hypothetical protein